jgi:hypothetical protein
MRALILFACLAVSTAASADEFHYLIPMAGYLYTADDATYYYATTTVQNLSPRPATVQTTDVYPYFAGGSCAAGEPFTIPAQGRITIGPMECMASLSALAIVSDEKLSVRTELDTHKTMVFGWDKLLLDATTDWIPAGVTALSEGIIRDDGPRKASLLVVNPSADQMLTVTVETSRPEFVLSGTMNVDVPPLSARYVNLPELRNLKPPPFIYSAEGRHLLRLTANGAWQGGVVSVYRGPSMYIPATPIVP